MGWEQPLKTAAPGPGGWASYTLPGRRRGSWPLKRLEGTSGACGAEAGVGAVAWLPLQFSERRWGARLAGHRARAPSAQASLEGLLNPGAHQAQVPTPCCPLLHTSSGWSPLRPHPHQERGGSSLTPRPHLPCGWRHRPWDPLRKESGSVVTGCLPPSDLQPPEAQGPPARVPLSANRGDCPQVSLWHLGLCSPSGPGGRARRPPFTGHRLELRPSVHQGLRHVTLPGARARPPEPGLPAPPSVR